MQRSAIVGGRGRRFIGPLLLLLSATLLGGCETVWFGALNRGPRQAPPVSVEYAPQRWLDVYRPRPAELTPTPVLVFFYGGRWQGGSRAAYAFVGHQLARRGVLTVVADYRLWPAVTFPAFIEDAAAAVGWMHAHAAAYGGDAARLFVAGHSAGAHIAALLGTDRRYLARVGLAPRDLAGVIGIAGPYDFLPLTDHDLQQVFGPPSGWPQSQPITFVDGDEPPFLLLHGADDRLVWPRNSARLAARLRDVGVAVEHRVYPDLGHLRILAGLRYPRLAPTLADLQRYVGAAAPGSAATGSGAAQ